MKKNHSNKKSILVSTFCLFSLLCGVSVSAQEQSKSPSQDQTRLITGTVTDNKAEALANAEVIIEPACDCQPCKDKNESCSICCPPGFVVAKTKVEDSGAFSIKLPASIRPGSYSLKVLSGRFSRAVDFKIDDKGKKLDFKITKQSDIKIDRDAASVGITIPVGVGRG